MRDTFSIWFSDYDAKPSLLYRSAMTLRDETWQHKASIENAKWWILYQPDQQTKQDIMARYKAVETDRPIVVILEDEGRTEFHKSWAVLRMPLNYVLFFQWLDNLLLKIQHGDASALTHDFSDDDRSGNSVAHDLVEQATWLHSRFRLTSWPNVARFGDDLKVVLYCSKMVRGYCSHAQLINMGMNEDQLSNLLTFAETKGLVQYEPKKEHEAASIATSEALPAIPPKVSTTKEPLKGIAQPMSDTLSNASISSQDTAQPIEEAEEVQGEKNTRSMQLFNAIYKMKNLFKRQT